MERAVTLLPQPLSPTKPRVFPGWISKLTPATATTFPSSRGKCVVRLRTDSRGVLLRLAMGLTSGVGIGCVAEAVSHEIEAKDGDDDQSTWNKKPWSESNRLEVLGLPQEDTPTDGGCRMPNPRKLREVSAMIIAGTARVVAAMMWLMNDGTMWRNMSLSCPAP